jgi:hypothetical protein
VPSENDQNCINFVLFLPETHEFRKFQVEVNFPSDKGEEVTYSPSGHKDGFELSEDFRSLEAIRDYYIKKHLKLNHKEIQKMTPFTRETANGALMAVHLEKNKILDRPRFQHSGMGLAQQTWATNNPPLEENKCCCALL